MYGGIGGAGPYAAAGVFGTWWGVGAVFVGVLILIAIGLVFVGFAL